MATITPSLKRTDLATITSNNKNGEKEREGKYPAAMGPNQPSLSLVSLVAQVRVPRMLLRTHVLIIPNQPSLSLVSLVAQVWVPRMLVMSQL